MTKNLSNFTDQELLDELARRKENAETKHEYDMFLSVVEEEYTEFNSWIKTIHEASEFIGEYLCENPLSERVAQYGSPQCDHKLLGKWEEKNYKVTHDLEKVCDTLDKYAYQMHCVIEALKADMADLEESEE